MNSPAEGLRAAGVRGDPLGKARGWNASPLRREYFRPLTNSWSSRIFRSLTEYESE